MPTISTTADTDFTVPAQGNFRIHCAGQVRLFAKIGGAYYLLRDWPSTGEPTGVGDVFNQEAGATYRWTALSPGAVAVVTQ